ncbi:MAG: ADP-ribosylglycohydrolase family protein, partial [Oscillospiraceae bacterium]|nr:ADP-ribosylglycohydrolase family protein [Oscillospiraceae bacterium]
MGYPRMPDLKRLADRIGLYATLGHEYGCVGMEAIAAEAEAALKSALERVKALAPDPALSAKEPDGLEGIMRVRPNGPRRMWKSLKEEKYMERLDGALTGRFAGCTLGAPVEFWEIDAMEKWAAYIGDPFPNQDYWSLIKNPSDLRYGLSTFKEYTRDHIDGVPVDDDVIYTLLGLLICEDHGTDFSARD